MRLTIFAVVLAVLVGLAALSGLAGTCAAYTLSGTVFFDYNGNGLRDVGEPGIEGARVSVGTLSSATDANGSYSLSGVSSGEIQVYVQSSTDDPATGFRYVSVFNGWVDIDAYEMNGVQVPAQYLADTDVQAIEEPVNLTISGNQELDVALMQGFLTLPYREEEADQYELTNYFDCDVARYVVRIYSGYITYSYEADQHVGVDFEGPQGKFVVSPAPGSVYSALVAWNGAKEVNAIHVDNLMTSVGHLNQLVVEEGSVLRGQIVGTNGDTGSCSGCYHIHQSLYDSGTRDENNWPANLDPFMDLITSDFHYETMDWSPWGYNYTISIGSPGYWTKCNDPQTFNGSPSFALPTLLSPSGSTTETTPTFSWNPVPGATWYEFSVDGAFGQVIGQWYEASEITTDSLCSITPSTALALGGYSWLVQAGNDNGSGPWSERMAFGVE